MKKLSILFSMFLVFGFSAQSQNDSAWLATASVKSLIKQAAILTDTVEAEEMPDSILLEVEESLVSDLEEFYFFNFELDLLDQIMDVPTEVIVYDFKGGILYTDNSEAGKIDLSKLPNGVQLLMKEGSVHYYIVF